MLSSAMLGIGYLTIPIQCKDIGLIPALILIALTGAISMFSSYLIVTANLAYSCDNLPSLIRLILGRIQFKISLVVVFAMTVIITSFYSFYSKIKSHLYNLHFFW